MEWVLQVVDEIDDGIAVLCLWLLGVAPELGLILAAGWGIAVFAMALLLGVGPIALAAAAVGVSMAAALSLQRRITGYNSP
jgi:hypothetical protein